MNISQGTTVWVAVIFLFAVSTVSAFINFQYKMRFPDFINSHRVHHSKQMIIDGESKRQKLAAISFESGFSNRNTFTKAFNKETGQSQPKRVQLTFLVDKKV